MTTSGGLDPFFASSACVPHYGDPLVVRGVALDALVAAGKIRILDEIDGKVTVAATSAKTAK